jgi:hypothetical protein
LISGSYFDNILRAENREAHCLEGTDPEVLKDEMCVDFLLQLQRLPLLMRERRLNILFGTPPLCFRRGAGPQAVQDAVVSAKQQERKCEKEAIQDEYSDPNADLLINLRNQMGKELRITRCSGQADGALSGLDVAELVLDADAL